MLDGSELDVMLLQVVLSDIKSEPSHKQRLERITHDFLVFLGIPCLFSLLLGHLLSLAFQSLFALLLDKPRLCWNVLGIWLLQQLQIRRDARDFLCFPVLRSIVDGLQVPWLGTLREEPLDVWGKPFQFSLC